MDYEWIRSYLTEALSLAEKPNYGGMHPSMVEKAEWEFDTKYLHIRAVVERVMPGLGVGLKTLSVYSQPGNVRILKQALYTLDEGAEVMKHLGPPPGPTLRAESLHPTVWDAAKSLWRSNHRRQAVEAAGVAVNAAMQDKLGRRDISNTKLVNEAFSLDAPKPDRTRLRIWPDDGSETFSGIHNGARSFAVGCFMALRNPSAHEAFDDELPEQIALEQLAAFSIVARWVEDGTVERAE